MTKRVLANTTLSVSHLCLGGNVFGWTTDEKQGHDILDGFVDLGGNFIDTADTYSSWVPGNSGGESESIIGSWVASRGNRSDVVIATKVAKLPTRPGLSRANIIAACDESLRRLQTDYIDLYYAHEDDQNTPLEETLAAFTELRDAGKVKFIAASNYSGARLLEAAKVADANGFAKYSALQNHYNLLERAEYESDSVPALQALGIESIPFFGLARGFLSGKYSEGVQVDSARADSVAEYANDAGWALLANLRKLADSHNVSVSAISLAWLRQQPTVAMPIASARTIDQLKEIMTEVTLSSDELQLLG